MRTMQNIVSASQAACPEMIAVVRHLKGCVALVASHNAVREDSVPAACGTCPVRITQHRIGEGRHCSSTRLSTDGLEALPSNPPEAALSMTQGTWRGPDDDDVDHTLPPWTNSAAWHPAAAP
jgi:hypothetical protein